MLQNPQLHYLDNAATTIVAPEVADVIDKAMREAMEAYRRINRLKSTLFIFKGRRCEDGCFSY